MTQETAWLDYTKPPPGYRIDEQDGEFDWYVGDDVSPDNGNASLITTEADALREAWEDYKAEHHPPGLPPCHADHRAAAWAWHDRRRAIAYDIYSRTCGGRPLAVLMAIALAWTDDECAEVEAYAALPFPRSVDMPQALQRVLLPQAPT